MGNTKNFKTVKRLLISVQQAKAALNMLLQDSEKFKLEKGIAELSEKPDLKDHINLMAWFALVRLLLESAYTYFNVPNDNLNKTTS